MLSHATAKTREPAFLVAAVTSPAGSHDRRSWVRQQWARNIALLHADNATAAPPRIVMRFAVGVNDSSKETVAALHREEEEWSDMLFLHGVKDLDPADIGWPWQVRAMLVHGRRDMVDETHVPDPGPAWLACRACLPPPRRCCTACSGRPRATASTTLRAWATTPTSGRTSSTGRC